jgi:hypothetical protein
MKMGRNQLCWCNSGKKYKQCHLGRDKQEPVKKSEVIKELNKFNSQKCCSVPDAMKVQCSNKIIKAHSVSKSSSLKEIAKDGHVYTTFNTKHNYSYPFKVRPQKVGINNASTFTGFCSTHDKELFSPIEDKPFEANAFHCFLVAYRALCREVFVKESVLSTFNFAHTLDKGKGIQEQAFIQSFTKHYSENNDLTLGDLRYIKKFFDQMLIDKNYEDVEHIVFELEQPSNVMTSAVGGYTVGFDGKLIQHISDDPSQIPDYVLINSFSSQGNGYVVLSWLKKHSVSNLKFVRQLLNTASISNSLSVFIFAMVENIYMSASWWEGLSDLQQEKICAIYAQGATEHTKNSILMKLPIFDDNRLVSQTTIGEYAL